MTKFWKILAAGFVAAAISASPALAGKKVHRQAADDNNGLPSWRQSVKACLLKKGVPLVGIPATQGRPGCVIVPNPGGVPDPKIRCLPAYRPAGDACSEDNIAGVPKNAIPWD